jgi:hypothetical protein
VSNPNPPLTAAQRLARYNALKRIPADPEGRAAEADEAFRQAYTPPQSRRERTAQADASRGGAFMAGLHRNIAAREQASTRASLPLAENAPDRTSSPIDLRGPTGAPGGESELGRIAAAARRDRDVARVEGPAAETTRRAREQGRRNPAFRREPPPPEPPRKVLGVEVGPVADTLLDAGEWVGDVGIPNAVQGMASGGNATMRGVGMLADAVLPVAGEANALDNLPIIGNIRNASQQSPQLRNALDIARRYLGLDDPSLAVKGQQIREMGYDLAAADGLDAVAAQLGGRLGYEVAQAGLMGGAVRPAQGAGALQRLATRGLGAPIDAFSGLVQDESTAEMIADATGNETARQIADSAAGRMGVEVATGLGLGTLLEEGVGTIARRLAAYRAQQAADAANPLVGRARDLPPDAMRTLINPAEVDLYGPSRMDDGPDLDEALPTWVRRLTPEQIESLTPEARAVVERLRTPVAPAAPVTREDLPFSINPPARVAGTERPLMAGAAGDDVSGVVRTDDTALP